MGRFVDLSRPLSDGMPGFRMRDERGDPVEYTASVEPFLTHEESAPQYADGVSFEITEVSFQTAVGTYLDSPYHRYPDRRDVSEIDLSEVVAEGIVVDATGRDARDEVGPEALPDDTDFEGKAVLFRFGWEDHWGTDRYYEYPFVSQEVVDRLADAGARLVGVDALNVDDSRDPERPAHSKLLEEEIFVVENLRGLDRVADSEFRFFAVPLRVKGAASMPIRAFAEITG